MKPPNLDEVDIVKRWSARSKRGLSEEERALWEAVVKSTKPLKKKPRIAKPQSDKTAPKTIFPKTILTKPVVVVPPTKIVAPERAKSEPPPLMALGRRERSQLSRGKKDIEARIDLHGMTQVRAHRALLNFLQRSSEDGLTFVLVITGKGRSGSSDAERGVLRRQVPEWLGLAECRPFVVGFEEAHVSHGGAGALYVRVRRRRF
jgi:DNA-nicking Smr family endonuclease